ncbi:MAG TPA: DegT/DnrJ/EryC1/StrS family aminotransferase [Steroidobacteraceae bacterium]
MSYLAPAGTVMSLSEVALGYVRGLRRDEAHQRLTAHLRARSGLARCWPVSSGRAAMTLILRAMRAAAADPEKDEVLIPGYTCYSVPASIVRAGLRPRLCDVDPATMGMSLEALERADLRRVLAIVSANLYGLPNALPAIERIARERGVYMLDDGAQALGARIAGRAVGSFGDAGLYSFDKGKIICTIQGGAIVAGEGPLAEHIAREVEQLEPSSLAETLSNCVKLPIYAVCLRPSLYGVVRKLPFLGLGRTVFETRYPISRLSAPQTGVAADLCTRIDSLNEQRRRTAARLAASIGDLPGIALPAIPADAEPAYARFPFRVLDPEARDGVIHALDAAGIGASASYPCALIDVPEVRALLREPSPTPGARQLASQIVTLPTHGYCPGDLGERVRQTLIGRPVSARASL